MHGHLNKNWTEIKKKPSPYFLILHIFNFFEKINFHFIQLYIKYVKVNFFS
jgi:hypothetical protein